MSVLALLAALLVSTAAEVVWVVVVLRAGRRWYTLRDCREILRRD